jgi:hypothetical protein
MEDQQHEDTPPANNRAVKLPPFWTANPRAWFASAEGAFQLRNIADERSRFFNHFQVLYRTYITPLTESTNQKSWIM